jgi:nucleoside-diphosphate kinase
MSLQRTLAIIKPDAVAKGAAGRILARIEESGFKVLAVKMLQMSEAQARGFYIVHEKRPFFGSLVQFMMQGPSIVLVLEADGAIARWRDLMGATDPAKAAAGTIRKEFASSIEANAVHGSDSPESAATEIPYFFNALEIWPR